MSIEAMLGKTIGEGGCSRVRAVRHCVTGQLGAAKIISKKTADKVKAQSLLNLYKSAETDPKLAAHMKAMPFGLEREIVIMKLLNHSNIVKLFDVWENRSELYLIMEYVEGGELFGYIDENVGLPEMETVFIFRQIVAALLYCHRIKIHHRDLKPENILIDAENLTIKLVDFGMAALQPEGRWLSTPCGSPHYAAPEVIRYKQYDGGQADVWSCGVILYVMLTGQPPFTYTDRQDLTHLFKIIAQAKYSMPNDLSEDAKDLISKILVPDPRRRINIEGVWKHPFLHKYDALFGFDEETDKDIWNGPKPRISHWDLRHQADLDKETLRNMRCLWHSESEETILRKLLNNEANQEKFFYNSLQKYKDQQLEHWPGEPDIAYSASDYHHLARPSQPHPVPHGRTKSQYSILNDEHLQAAYSFQQPPPSEKSYDPFRSSREPSLANKGNYMNVTVHRGVVRPSSSHKRGVSFAHLRKSSTGSRLTVTEATSPQGTPEQRKHLQEAAAQKPQQELVPALPSTPAQASSSPAPPAAVLKNTKPRLKVKHPETPGRVIDGEVRKASVELEKALDEAFNRTSERYYGDQTIRIVDASSPAATGPLIQPLNIRKKSSTSTLAQVAASGTPTPTRPYHLDSLNPATPTPVHQLGHKPSLTIEIDQTASPFAHRDSLDVATQTTPLQTPVSASSTSTAAKEERITKKRSWFKRRISERDPPEQQQQAGDYARRPRIPDAWQGLDDRLDRPKPRAISYNKQDRNVPNGSASSHNEFPLRDSEKEKSDKLAGLRKNLASLFGKKMPEKKGRGSLMLMPSNYSASSLPSSAFSFGDDFEPSVPRYIEGQNWLSRFLHIKPAAKIIVFKVGRGRVRQEIVRLLRDWKRFGVRDVKFDRATNIIQARVDKTNRELHLPAKAPARMKRYYEILANTAVCANSGIPHPELQMKPVAFSVELFTVLQQGRRAQLCVGRFTQTRGAASSFRKVVDILEDVLKGKGIIIEDEVRAREVAAVLGY
ncbi:putative serine threonine protein kinase [Diplodia seriata]|uniref:non-specific serine/threonine protein kinase n=1 Tax=Diplodia seriata TaxID=420778 RepID=A0A0G2FTU1_9PEZI|nr:putative serine threonine protein kinase [Diplodia seriata]